MTLVRNRILFAIEDDVVQVLHIRHARRRGYINVGRIEVYGTPVKR